MCTDCPAGKWNSKIAGKIADCYECDVHSQGLSAAGSNSSEDCICNAGFYYIYDIRGGGCQSCAGGTYKDIVGNQACTNCPASSYSEEDYDNGVISCVSCPADSTCMNIVNPISYPFCGTPYACGCNAGYYGDAGIPENELPCTPCPAGRTCSVGDCTYPDHCEPGSPPLPFLPCDAGYTGPDGGVCTACAAGTWKNTSGSGACSSCGAS
jgi:hypothetical protein